MKIIYYLKKLYFLNLLIIVKQSLEILELKIILFQKQTVVMTSRIIITITLLQ